MSIARTYTLSVDDGYTHEVCDDLESLFWVLLDGSSRYCAQTGPFPSDRLELIFDGSTRYKLPHLGDAPAEKYGGPHKELALHYGLGTLVQFKSASLQELVCTLGKILGEFYRMKNRWYEWSISRRRSLDSSHGQDSLTGHLGFLRAIDNEVADPKVRRTIHEDVSDAELWTTIFDRALSMKSLGWETDSVPDMRPRVSENGKSELYVCAEKMGAVQVADTDRVQSEEVNKDERVQPEEGEVATTQPDEENNNNGTPSSTLDIAPPVPSPSATAAAAFTDAPQSPQPLRRTNLKRAREDEDGGDLVDEPNELRRSKRIKDLQKKPKPGPPALEVKKKARRSRTSGVKRAGATSKPATTRKPTKKSKAPNEVVTATETAKPRREGLRPRKSKVNAVGVGHQM